MARDQDQALAFPCAPASTMACNVPLRTFFLEEVLRPLDLQMLDALGAALIYMWAQHAAAFCSAHADAPAPAETQCDAARTLLQLLRQDWEVEVGRFQDGVKEQADCLLGIFTTHLALAGEALPDVLHRLGDADPVGLMTEVKVEQSGACARYQLQAYYLDYVAALNERFPEVLRETCVPLMALAIRGPALDIYAMATLHGHPVCQLLATFAAHADSGEAHELQLTRLFHALKRGAEVAAETTAPVWVAVRAAVSTSAATATLSTAAGPSTSTTPASSLAAAGPSTSTTPGGLAALPQRPPPPRRHEAPVCLPSGFKGVTQCEQRYGLRRPLWFGVLQPPAAGSISRLLGNDVLVEPLPVVIKALQYNAAADGRLRALRAVDVQRAWAAHAPRLWCSLGVKSAL